ncbi:aldehyde dehydrogenase [Photobacterium ganghwense]|uniref:Aldehyde dehydrogenase n=1 Tax=Photobacterium ganghwense TaxID=320778 RepID=A0A0J1HFK3_9GAMM|nr:aldehyde dehydrogenase [Photobacterium ganghwense]KLV10379.1 aldehyde dehydrogenase [Photobacterium ganghwense]PSU09726.1 aldehyde dehydrogenase [Photobacterium ganghwense]QSV16973.1 aldehyde dehydrogenase [Photobacterium ganghwense]
MRVERNFVNNQFQETSVSDLITVYNPENEEPIAQVTAATSADVLEAVNIANQAQKTWRKLTSIQRGEHLKKLADKLAEKADEIGQILALESGKSVEDATNETHYAADITRYHAEWARRIEGEIIPSDTPDENLLLHREPIGVVACLIPFNYPVYTLLRKIAPALITGNTVVVRPSNNTPCSAFAIAQAILEAELPAGVVNILTMDHTTAETMCTHPKVGMITLTGSVGAGRKVLEYSQVNIAKSSLELGGKTPAIVTPDADLEKAAREIVISKTSNCGQLCTAVERVYVHESIQAEFIQRLKQEMESISFGARSLKPSNMGPLVNENARLNIHQMVERAIDDGAHLLTGGYIPEGKGHFYPPTILTQCRQDMEIVQEEIFGPVLPILTYKTIDEAIELANDHQFGLASLIYTENYRDAMKVANNIEAGEFYINRIPADPYQGYHQGWKRSGLGGDDGKHGMLDYTQTRLVIAKY